ncbi:uncharacterized protein LOC133818114 [Humulus lupulus]|uniref:uncharacterized protein LOC133818114 n=1 Tax=Humulus lupulus TaxID=3486 RepID=UPI002B406B00|nr:uncharacterized protein LOC133818114 [Humulus lupulus]
MPSDLSMDVVSPREMDLNEDVSELLYTKRGCCFWIPCFSTDRSSSDSAGSVWWQRMRPVENDDPWWSRSWKKVREWSELVAGPKWKTFIRRFNKNRPFGHNHKQVGKFNYDEFNYALNFDEGPGQNGHFDDEDLLHRDFSSRFASVPPSAKSSMDLGKDGPSFT